MIVSNAHDARRTTHDPSREPLRGWLALHAGARPYFQAFLRRVILLMSSETNDRFQYVDSQLHDRWKPTHVLAACVAILAAGLAIYARYGSGVLQFRSDIFSEIGGALVSVTILVTFVEIAAATIVDIFRAKSYSDWSMRVQRVSDRLADETSSVEVLKRAYERERHFVKRLYQKHIIPVAVDDLKPNEQAVKDYRSWLDVVKNIYTFALARHGAITRVRVSYVVFAVGFLLAVGGVSVFSFVFTAESVNNWFDTLLDWLVTACVIGGGSTRLNGLLSRLSELLDRSRQAGVVK